MQKTQVRATVSTTRRNTKRPQICPECQFPLVSRAGLLVHLRNVHNLKAPTPTREELTCPVCQREFTDRKSVTNHVRRTHGMKRWAIGDELEPPSDAAPNAPAPHDHGSNGSNGSNGAEAAAAETPGLPLDPADPRACPECKAAGVSHISNDPRGLGVHRLFKHGVPGKSRERNKHTNSRRARQSRQLAIGGVAKDSQNALIPHLRVRELMHAEVPTTSFCPRCGCLTGAFCPKCGADMQVVAAALSFVPTR